MGPASMSASMRAHLSTPVVRKNSIRPVPAPANIRDVSRPAPSGRTRLLLHPDDAGISRLGVAPLLRADPERPGPTPCAGVPHCNGSPTLSKSIASVILIAESANPNIRGGSRQSGVRISRWPLSSTALDDGGAERRLHVTHPFHPLCGREFEVVTYRKNWGDERVYVRGPDDRLLSLPVAWTDMGVASPFVMIAAGRSLFRFEDLLELSRLLEQLG